MGPVILSNILLTEPSEEMHNKEETMDLFSDFSETMNLAKSKGLGYSEVLLGGVRLPTKLDLETSQCTREEYIQRRMDSLNEIYGPDTTFRSNFSENYSSFPLKGCSRQNSNVFKNKKPNNNFLAKKIIELAKLSCSSNCELSKEVIKLAKMCCSGSEFSVSIINGNCESVSLQGTMSGFNTDSKQNAENSEDVAKNLNVSKTNPISNGLCLEICDAETVLSKNGSVYELINEENNGSNVSLIRNVQPISSSHFGSAKKENDTVRRCSRTIKAATSRWSSAQKEGIAHSEKLSKNVKKTNVSKIKIRALKKLLEREGFNNALPFSKRDNKHQQNETKQNISTSLNILKQSKNGKKQNVNKEHSTIPKSSERKGKKISEVEGEKEDEEDLEFFLSNRSTNKSFLGTNLPKMLLRKMTRNPAYELHHNDKNSVKFRPFCSLQDPRKLRALYSPTSWMESDEFKKLQVEDKQRPFKRRTVYFPSST